MHTRQDRWLLAPLVAFFALFVVAPLGLVLGVSLYTDPSMTSMGAGQYVKFLGDPFNRQILFETLAQALGAVVLSMAFGYPIAYLYTLLTRGWQRILLFAILLPMLTSSVVRTFAWVVILGREGLVNQLVLGAGWVEQPLTLLYTQGAVLVAVSQIEMPMMILPLISSLAAVDPRLRDASMALGAGRWRTFFKVILPLSVPGLLAGSLLVFAASASAFVTQTLVGGGRLMFMPFYIYQQAIQSQDYPFSAAIAMVLLAAVLLVVVTINTLGRRSRGFVHG